MLKPVAAFSSPPFHHKDTKRRKKGLTQRHRATEFFSLPRGRRGGGGRRRGGGGSAPEMLDWRVLSEFAPQCPNSELQGSEKIKEILPLRLPASLYVRTSNGPAGQSSEWSNI